MQGGTVVPLAPPPILGLGTGGGFAYVLEDLRGGDPKALAQVAARPGGRGKPGPAARAASSAPSRPRNPSIYLDIDRDKAQILGVKLSDVFQALQASLGGYFVNNINLFGRTWQVQVQAEAADRSSGRRHLPHQRAQHRRQDDPAAQPGGGARRRRAAGADPLQQSAGRDRPGQPGARRLVRAGAGGDGGGRGARRCRRAIAGEWTDTAFQEKRAEGKTAIILGFAVLFAYLFLVALYESWTIPVPVLLSVSVGIARLVRRASCSAG